MRCDAGTSAIVSGGASGLGAATVRRLAGKGARVVIFDLPSSNGEALSEELGEGVTFVAGNVLDESDVAAAVERAADNGPLRIAISCAGIAPPSKILGSDPETAFRDFERVVGINLLGTFNVLRLAARAIADTDPVDGERGAIILTASVAAFEGQIGQAAYAASKAGVVGLTLPAARELARHLVRVVAIAPGIFETPLLAALPEAARASLSEQVPHPSRLGKPDEFAALVEHIVENPMLNGETIRLDGAIRMAPR